MPRVVPPARHGFENGSGRPVGVSTWKPESIKALQVTIVSHMHNIQMFEHPHTNARNRARAHTHTGGARGEPGTPPQG
jgi:hypothetical protein